MKEFGEDLANAEVTISGADTSAKPAQSCEDKSGFFKQKESAAAEARERRVGAPGNVVSDIDVDTASQGIIAQTFQKEQAAAAAESRAVLVKYFVENSLNHAIHAIHAIQIKQASDIVTGLAIATAVSKVIQVQIEGDRVTALAIAAADEARIGRHDAPAHIKIVDTIEAAVAKCANPENNGITKRSIYEFISRCDDNSDDGGLLGFERSLKVLKSLKGIYENNKNERSKSVIEERIVKTNRQRVIAARVSARSSTLEEERGVDEKIQRYFLAQSRNAPVEASTEDDNNDSNAAPQLVPGQARLISNTFEFNKITDVFTKYNERRLLFLRVKRAALTMLAIFHIQNGVNHVWGAMHMPAILGIVGIAWYFPRLLRNSWIVLRCCFQKDGDFKSEWNKHKYLIANDFSWFTINLLTTIIGLGFWSGAAVIFGPTGMLLTVLLYSLDVANSAYKLRKKTQHNNAIVAALKSEASEGEESVDPKLLQAAEIQRDFESTQLRLELRIAWVYLAGMVLMGGLAAGSFFAFPVTVPILILQALGAVVVCGVCAWSVRKRRSFLAKKKQEITRKYSVDDNANANANANDDDQNIIHVNPNDTQAVISRKRRNSFSGFGVLERERSNSADNSTDINIIGAATPFASAHVGARVRTRSTGSTGSTRSTRYVSLGDLTPTQTQTPTQTPTPTQTQTPTQTLTSALAPTPIPIAS